MRERDKKGQRGEEMEKERQKCTKVLEEAEGDNRRRVKGSTASICHSADGMSGENREIGPKPIVLEFPAGVFIEKLSAFEFPAASLRLCFFISISPSPSALVAKVRSPFFFLPWCVRLARLFIPSVG